MHGAGFTGSGEDFLASIVTVETTADGTVRVLTSSTEIGQGTNTILAQIAADALGAAMDDVEIAQPDTSVVPNSGPTVASRTCMVVGKLIENACHDLRRMLTDSGHLRDGVEFRDACRAAVAERGPLRASAQYQPREGARWDDEKYEGDAYGTYAWAAYVAEV